MLILPYYAISSSSFRDYYHQSELIGFATGIAIRKIASAHQTQEATNGAGSGH
jgi:hypothetical protein